jgi:hypothetical protein
VGCWIVSIPGLMAEGDELTGIYAVPHGLDIQYRTPRTVYVYCLKHFVRVDNLTTVCPSPDSQYPTDEASLLLLLCLTRSSRQ